MRGEKNLWQQSMWARYRRIGVIAPSPDAARHWLQFPLFAYSLLSSKNETVKAKREDGHPPLVLLHGLGGNRGQLFPLAFYLARFGRTRSYRLGFDLALSLEGMAAALAATIEDIRRVTGASQVEIVAHSLGGIVARLSILHHGLHHSVRTLVTLGTPHHGTLTARYGRHGICRDLEPGSPLIRKLRETPWPKEVRGVTLYSRNDIIIVPARTATFPGAEAVDVSPFTHFSYLLDPRGWEAVRRALSVK